MLCLEAIINCPADGAVGDAACKALAELQHAATVSAAMADAEKEHFEAEWETKLRTEREACLTKCGEELERSIVSGDQPAVEALLGAVSILLDDTGVRHRAVNPLI